MYYFQFSSGAETLWDIAPKFPRGYRVAFDYTKIMHTTWPSEKCIENSPVAALTNVYGSTVGSSGHVLYNNIVGIEPHVPQIVNVIFRWPQKAQPDSE